MAAGQLRHAVPVTAGTTYVVSYFAPVGHYATSEAYYMVVSGSAARAAAARWPTAASGGNGVYGYGGDVFPTSTFGAANYWVDAVFTTGRRRHDAADGHRRTPSPAPSSVRTTATLTATFSEPVQPATVDRSR